MSETPTLSQSYFLSYSRSDEAFALRFATDLRDRGIAMWVDQLDIRPSEHWDRAIERAVHQCRGLLVILSPRSVESDNVADEISFAIDHKKPVLPVMIEKCRLPLRITRMQLIDATSDYDRALLQCLEAIGGDGLSCSRGAGEPAQPCGIHDAQAIAIAKVRLTDVVGPIAGILVDKAAMRARSVSELYALLAENIASQKDRERFVALAGTCDETSPAEPTPTVKPRQSSVPQAEADRLGAVLTQYLGPISAALVRRESEGAESPDDLQRRLASLIPNERERAEFLHKAQTH